jgi:hypothetical protein
MARCLRRAFFLKVARAAGLRLRHFIGARARLFPKHGVSSQAIRTAIPVGNRDGNLLGEFGVNLPRAERARPTCLLAPQANWPRP